MSWDAPFLGGGLDLPFELFEIRLCTVDGESRTVVRNGIQLFLVDVDGNHFCTKRRGNLNAIGSDAADPDDNGEVTFVKATSNDRLVWSGYSIRNN